MDNSTKIRYNSTKMRLVKATLFSVDDEAPVVTNATATPSPIVAI